MTRRGRCRCVLSVDLLGPLVLPLAVCCESERRTNACAAACERVARLSQFRFFAGVEVSG
eukprot:11094436-Alexandrium_andersonii.AAC.1